MILGWLGTDELTWLWSKGTRLDLFLLEKEDQVFILKTVTDLLIHGQIEVRQLASVTLSGLVRCSQRDVIQTIRVFFNFFMIENG